MSNILNIVLFMIMFYSFFRLFSASRQNGKGKQLVNIVSNVNHRDEFFEQIDEMIRTCGDPVYENKARVIKLWGKAYHHEYDDFAQTAAELNIDNLTRPNRDGSVSISENEDSFFYIYMGIPNLLYGNDALDCVKVLQEKAAPYNEKLADQIVCRLGAACTDFCERKNDRGIGFFQKLLDGDYGEFRYSKSLIGLYKMISNAMLAKYYEEEGTLAEHEELNDLLQQFANTGLGQRWLKAIDLKVETETEEPEDEDAEVIDMNEAAPAEETADEETAAEETKEEEKE